MDPVAIEHFAEEAKGLVQSCSRCGRILSDNRNVMVQGDEGDCAPIFWRLGKVYNLGLWWSTTPPTDIFRPCNPS